MEASTKTPTPYIGRKISRMREMLGVKQETLAQGLGISQQAVSKLEQSERLEDERLEEVAKILGVSKEAIENFNESSVHFHIENMHDQSVSFPKICPFKIRVG